jgi:hypothetical protein
MPQSSNSFIEAFIVEPSKLQRIVGVINDAVGGSGEKITYQADLQSEKKLTFDEVQHLLQHDNAIGNPIRNVKIEGEGVDGESRCSILFHTEKMPYLSSISYVIDGNDIRWVRALSSELDEQIERMLLRDWPYRLLQSVNLRNIFPALIVLLFVVVSILAIFNESGTSNLLENRKTLLESAASASTQEQKIDTILRLTVFLVQQRSSQSDATLKLPSFTVSGFIVLGLLVLTIGLFVYVIRTCYPTATFAWGDVGEKYYRLIQRRRAIWGLIFVAIFLALVVNLAGVVLAKYINL